MKILLIDNGSNLLSKLQQLIPGSEVTMKFGDVKLSDTEDFDLIILSGGGFHNVLQNRGEFQEEIKIIESGKPLIGICFGFELIAHTFGAKIKKLDTEQVGTHEIEVLDKSLGGPNQVKVYEGHKWGISELPEVFEVLAKSASGPEIIKHKNQPIYGIQFHPENLVEETKGDELFMNLLKQFLTSSTR